MNLNGILRRALLRSVKIVAVGVPVQQPAQCRNCRWMEGEYGWRPTERYHNGTCRRHAPIAVRDDRMGTPNVAMWPYVKGDDGCGDFEQINIKPAIGAI